MIDTIVLHIYRNYKITDFEKFKPNAKDLFTPPYRNFYGNWVVYSKQNPKKNELIYKPKLTLCKDRKYNYPILRTELSLPKLFFGNNLFELTNDNLNAITENLKTRLSIMGVEIKNKVIKNTKIKRIDFSKNLILDENTSIYSLFNEIAKSSMNNSILRGTTIIYPNDGSTIKFVCKSYEVVFYDKTKELQTIGINIKKNVFRMEVRLKNEKTIKAKLKKAGITYSSTKFKDLFNEDVSEKILNYYWGIIQNNMPKTYSVKNDEELFCHIEGIEGEKNNVRKRLMFLAMNKLEKEIGKAGFKKFLLGEFDNDKRRTDDLYREYKKCKVNADINIDNNIEEITKKLKEFILLTRNVSNTMQMNIL
jgi:hypothetical protein